MQGARAIIDRGASILGALPLGASLLLLAPRGAVAGEAAPQPPASRSAAASHDSSAPRNVAPERRASRKPLSPDDAALVHELPLVENAELLRNLELFTPSDKTRTASAEAPQTPDSR